MINDVPRNINDLPKIDKKILVAEDIELNQMLVKSALEEWGCNVDIAVNGLEALNKVKETNYDLVLMDLQMPVMDGLAATHEIRNLPEPEKANLLIIAFTSVDYKDEKKYIDAGMNDYIIKPYRKDDLHRKISTLLNTQNASLNTKKNTVPNDNAGINNGEKENIKPIGGSSLNNGLKLYSTSMIDSIGKNNSAFTSKMIVMFAEIISQDFNSLKLEAAKGNWTEVSQLAHRMKSTFGNMGENSVLGYIKALETGTSNSLAVVVQLEQELDKVLIQIKTDYPHLF